MSAHPVAHIGWGISAGIAATAYDMLDQAPTLSASELGWWFGLSDDQAELLRAHWRRDMAHAVAVAQGLAA